MSKPSRESRAGGGGAGRLLFWTALGLSTLLFGAALLGRDGLLAVLVNRWRLERLREVTLSLRAENRRIRREIHSLRRDLTSIERIAREDLGLVKPGETVYEFLPAREGRSGGGGGKAGP